MFKTLHYLVLLSLLSVVFALAVIDNGERFDKVDEIASNNIEKDNEQCSSLSPDLVKEIQSYQPLVDQITSAVVNGKYSGDTWNA